MSGGSVRYRVDEGVLARSVGDAVVLFHPASERLLTLNASGTRIWELLSEEPDPARIAARLTQEFDDPELLLQQQVLEFLSQLETEQIIRREGDPSPPP
jgi:PqqD family protein of HPr-rel-A system